MTQAIGLSLQRVLGWRRQVRCAASWFAGIYQLLPNRSSKLSPRINPILNVDPTAATTFVQAGYA